MKSCLPLTRGRVEPVRHLPPAAALGLAGTGGWLSGAPVRVVGIETTSSGFSSLDFLPSPYHVPTASWNRFQTTRTRNLLLLELKLRLAEILASPEVNGGTQQL